MANSYNAQLGQPGGGIVYGNSRSITIITDTLQSAFSIARTRCLVNEQVLSVAVNDIDVVIDYSAVSNPASQQI